MRAAVRPRACSFVRLLGVLASVAGAAACQTSPPAITAITVFAAAADGTPEGDDLCRSLARPPIPLVGVRPGTDPGHTSSFMNDPDTGGVAITLARGTQSFLLYTAWRHPSEHYVITIALDGEATPSLSALTDRAAVEPIAASHAASVLGMDGEPVPNHSAISTVRGDYRVTLLSARPPQPTARTDALSPWRLVPDNIADSVGTISMQVERIAPQ